MSRRIDKRRNSEITIIPRRNLDMKNAPGGNRVRVSTNQNE